MLAFTACWMGVFGLLVIGELLRHLKILKGENLRKFIHISVGIFAAVWPWILSWRQIQLLSLAMLVVVLINRYHRLFHFSSNIKREGYGDIFLALAILACALLTDVKIFFAIAMLELAVADGLAAVIGKKFGRHWQYKVLGETKTVLGSMAFWLASLYILAISVVLGAHNIIDYQHYAILLLALPPILTAIENVSSQGLDDLTVPLITLLALHIAQMS